MNPGGHLRTVGRLLRRRTGRNPAPVSEAWSTSFDDPVSGKVQVTGRLARSPVVGDVVVLIHGLGGSSESPYLIEAAREAHSLGVASLRLNMRGADGRVADFYHGGLTADLEAAVGELGRTFDRIFVLGYSLGGHVALRYATEAEGDVFRACAAVCSPLDLGAAADGIDHWSRFPYRRYVLRHLKERISRDAMDRFGIDSRRLLAVTRLREWDALTVVPRFGFRDTDDYYARASVGSRLSAFRCPALLVAAEDDPMVSPSAIRPCLEGAGATGSRLAVRWLRRGGHVALPGRADLGLAGEGAPGRNPIAQILLWLLRTGDVGEGGF